MLLAAAYFLRKPLERLGRQTLVDSAPLENSLRQVVSAVAPVMLAGAIPLAGDARVTAIGQAVYAVTVAVSKLSAPAQREVAELFALLSLAPARIALAGVHRPWAEATENDVRGFLDAWRGSRIELLKSGYMALHDLILGAWYADSGTWRAIGYPGPPDVPPK